MRMLLMISNNQMSLRELYSAVLDNHPAGWITSFMSGLPSEVESIVSGYDAVIYELGAPDSADRVTGAKELLSGGVPVITHVEGRQSAERAQELEHAGVFVVANPISGAAIGSTLEVVAKRLRKDKAARKESFGARFRRVFTG